MQVSKDMLIGQLLMVDEGVAPNSDGCGHALSGLSFRTGRISGRGMLCSWNSG